MSEVPPYPAASTAREMLYDPTSGPRGPRHLNDGRLCLISPVPHVHSLDDLSSLQSPPISRHSRRDPILSASHAPSSLHTMSLLSPMYSSTSEQLLYSNAGIHLPDASLASEQRSFRPSWLASFSIPPFHTPIRPHRADPRLPVLDFHFNLKAHLHSPKFPKEHMLNPLFAEAFQLEDELGSGGYGFVMTAHHRATGCEVAVKFIVKETVPEHAWIENEDVGRLPAEIMLLTLVRHDNIVQLLDVYEDELYYYMIQELHGSPWRPFCSMITQHGSSGTPGLLSPPFLSPCVSENSLCDSEPNTPPPQCIQLTDPDTEQKPFYPAHYQPHGLNLLPPVDPQTYSLPLSTPRASHDLFEFIEQSPHRRLHERQARYIFAQIVEAVYYLDCLGITHRDIKDENVVIDRDLKVKLIDFGSAVMTDPTQPRPYYKLFFGTSAYAASEILRKQPYQAAPAEIWTLGILLSYLLTGASPFMSEWEAMQGRIRFREGTAMGLSANAVSLMRRCLDPDPEMRADINEVRQHVWLEGEPCCCEEGA